MAVTSIHAVAATTPTPQPQAGHEYTVLTTPAGNMPADKIQILDFFWYGCPHCATFDTKLAAWLKKQGPDVVLKRVPVAFSSDFVAHQKLYHALEALGLAEKFSGAIFAEIQVKRNYLLTPESQADFLEKHGVSKKRFLAAWHAFKTASDVQRDTWLTANYKIDGVPSLIVQGKYLTSPSMTKSLDDTTRVLDYLVSRIRSKKAD